MNYLNRGSCMRWQLTVVNEEPQKPAEYMERKETEELKNILSNKRKTVITWPFCCVNKCILQSSPPQARTGTGKGKAKKTPHLHHPSYKISYSRIWKILQIKKHNQYRINKLRQPAKYNTTLHLPN